MIHEKFLREKVVLVDSSDKSLGVVSKTQAHEKGFLHRAFSVFVIDGNSNMLIQKRAITKYHSAGLWANTCCSHPQIGENIVESAKKRLKEEMNISAIPQEIFAFEYNHKFDDNMFEHEIDHVLISTYNGSFKINKEEASEAKWIGFSELKKEIEDKPEIFAPWFLIAVPKVLEIFEKKNLQKKN
ncbi:MAG: isopentenyl-diphosphate Delta-isomerase [Clostridia bacterium]